MAQDLSLAEVVNRAYARALPPKKLLKLVQARTGGKTPEQVGNDLSAALVSRLLPNPPSLLLSYLTELIASNSNSNSDSQDAAAVPLLTAKTFFVHLLFHIAEHDVPPTASLLSIASILVSTPTGLEDGGAIPSSLPHPADAPSLPIPDIGTSASALNSPSHHHHRSTLSLLLPLLRTCATTPPSPLSTLVARAVAILSPFPAPSLDVGLEAGQLLPSLPEDIGGPLRNTLSGLMADLSTDVQPAAQGDVVMADTTALDGSGLIERLAPLRPTLVFLLEHARRTSKWSKTEPSDSSDASNSPRTPVEGLIQIIKIAPYLSNNPAEFLSALIEIAVRSLLELPVDGMDVGAMWNFVVQDAVGLVRWWKDHSEDSFPFPDDLSVPLSTIFQTLVPQMQTFSESISQRYAALVQQSEAEDDSSSLTPLEGWHIPSLQETLVTRLVQLDIITSDQAAAVAPGVSIHTSQTGESLLNRLAAESYPHLPPVAHIIQYAYGASTSFASEFVQTVKACPQSLAPENLFNYVASQPALIASLTGYTTPPALVDVLVKHLIEAPVDESARLDDPQGSLTRFGEGVVLVEAVVAHFDLPLPTLLEDARRATSFTHLPTPERECMNGWVKAIFGSDGIEDQILLATSPQALYKLAPNLIQQAIAATAANLMDLDTLHSGLSYFSQPLLSWCLGGVVGWLCAEIQRQGLLSALHLVVLQDLILGHTCPEALLRVNSDALNSILDPSSGLGPVLESSGFDTLGIRTKLDSIGLHPSALGVVRPPLRTSLQIVRQLEIAPPSWEKVLLDSIQASLSTRGEAETTQDLMDELLNPSASTLATGGDSLSAFTPILLSLHFGRRRTPLVGYAVWSWLPTLFGPSSAALSLSPNQGQLVTWAIRRSLYLVTLSERESRLVGRAVDDLVDELEYELGRPVFRPESDTVTQTAQGKRRKVLGDKVTGGQRGVLEVLVRGLRDDEELRARYASLARLEGLV